MLVRRRCYDKYYRDVHSLLDGVELRGFKLYIGDRDGTVGGIIMEGLLLAAEQR